MGVGKSERSIKDETLDRAEESKDFAATGLGEKLDALSFLVFRTENLLQPFGDHQALAGLLILPKSMAEVAVW